MTLIDISATISRFYLVDHSGGRPSNLGPSRLVQAFLQTLNVTKQTQLTTLGHIIALPAIHQMRRHSVAHEAHENLSKNFFAMGGPS